MNIIHGKILKIETLAETETDAMHEKCTSSALVGDDNAAVRNDDLLKESLNLNCNLARDIAHIASRDGVYGAKN